MNNINKAIEIVDQIQICGFPGTGNLTKIEALCAKLKDTLPKRADFNLEMHLIEKDVYQIKDLLAQKKEIPIKMYEQYNVRLIVLKENLISSRPQNNSH